MLQEATIESSGDLRVQVQRSQTSQVLESQISLVHRVIRRTPY